MGVADISEQDRSQGTTLLQRATRNKKPAKAALHVLLPSLSSDLILTSEMTSFFMGGLTTAIAGTTGAAGQVNEEESQMGC